MHRPLRLTLDRAALQHNWRWLAERAGTACGAAIKADGYGIGARGAMGTLFEAGCRDFFVSTWAEAEELGPVPDGVTLVVLHGVGPGDVEAALVSNARPVLNSVEQVERWKAIAPDRPCDLMIDTGINRLGLRLEEISCLEGLAIDTLHSHLACGDEDHPLNATQLERFREVAAAVPAKRYSLANSAGVCLGRDYSFDLVRPGLALYGGVPRREAEGHIRQVAHVEAQIVQRRTVRAGESCGYGATFTAEADTLEAGEFALPVLGRVSMDLTAIDCDAAPDLKAGDWVELDYDLPTASAQSGLSQYELLTTLGDRFERRWR